jgi:hypothetical protein
MDIIDNNKLEEMKIKLKELAKEKARTNAKQYYEKNKNVILAKMCSRVQCDRCFRVVIFNNLKLHQTKDICRKLQKI